MVNKVYLAGSCKNRKAIKCLMTDIENWGHKIMFDWTIRVELKDLNLYVREDIRGMKECDSFIYCMDGSRSRGKYFELGYATALGKRIGIYLIPTYYITNNLCRSDRPPFDIIIENESIFVKSIKYPVLSDVNELKIWLDTR